MCKAMWLARSEAQSRQTKDEGFVKFMLNVLELELKAA